MQLHTRPTTRTGRFATIGDPTTARRCWFVLHGYGQLIERVLRRFEGVVPPDTYLVAPEGLSRFYTQMPRPDGSHLDLVGATWMTRASRDDDIADALRWLEQIRQETTALLPAGIPVGVLAFSQGVAMATRWLAMETFTASQFVAWAGRPAVDAEEAPLARQLAVAQVTLVAGDADPFVSDTARDEVLATLRRWQPAAQTMMFAGGHHLDPATLGSLLAHPAR
jgi:predicted esterase